MAPYRVVQWSTGNVGRRALRAMIDHDGLDVVGVHAHAPEKVGCDAGTLAGVAPIGVKATDNVDELIAAAPDCVVYTPGFIDYPLVARLLRSGINAVTTGDFLTGRHHRDEYAELQAAALNGGATFLGTGFEPGFVNVVAGFLTGACRKVHSVKLVETLNCAQYPVRDAWAVLGFGKPLTTRLTEVDPESSRYGLGYFESLDLGFMTLPKGTIAGQRRIYRGLWRGRTIVELAICWRMSDDGLNPQWTDAKGFTVEIEGEPRVDAVIRFGPPRDDSLAEDHDVMSLLVVGTAMAAVHAIPHVCRAQPGVVVPTDLPIIGARGALVDVADAAPA
ncbi:dihydrodipicolinate reductase [Mycolicibacterium rhodesiae JS60]|nr:dihydrodipicolinate reductase [Mycolicibacterium rhodesiae JS60]